MTGEGSTLALNLIAQNLRVLRFCNRFSRKVQLPALSIFMLQSAIETAFSPRQPGQNAILYYLTQAVQIFELGQLPATI